VPVRYEIRPSADCIFVTLEGIVTDEDVITEQQKMFADALFEGRYSRLIDGTGMTKLMVKAATVRLVAQAAVDRGLRKAALVANSDHVYGLMRMYEGYAYAAECRVYRDLNEAWTWLLGREPKLLNTR
jgi:hypothetical protein